MGGCHTHQHHHAGHVHKCTAKSCACGVTIFLCFCVTCARPVHGHGHGCSGRACRLLAAENTSAAKTSFVEWLQDESPIDHILGLYEASGSQDDVGSWLLESGSAASEVEEADADGHEGHNHRRLLDHAGHDHDDHGHPEPAVEEEDHSGHDHGLEEPAPDSSLDVHDHSGHDHGETTSKTYLNAATLASVRAAGATERETVEQALAFITACQIDANCDLGEPTQEDTADLNSRTHFELKVGLAFSFIAMTVISSLIPVMMMRLPMYNGLLSCANAFSGSVFLTVGITHLLPHVAEYEASANLDTDYPVGLATVTIGFVLVLFIEHIVFNVHGHAHERRDSEEQRSTDIPLLERTKDVAVRFQEPLITQFAVALHAVLECITMGLAINRKDLLLLYAAICAHKVFTSMSLATRFLRLGCSIKLLTLLLLPFHLLPPLAIILSAAIGADSPLASLIMVGLATGTFLYVGAFEVVCEEFAEHEDPRIDVSRLEVKAASSYKASGEIEGQMMSSAVVKDYAVGEEWQPSKLVRFMFFVLGVALLLGITAALPKHEH